MKPAQPIVGDEHLRAALRHAPDADVAAPVHISAQIIAAAHRSAGERAAPFTRAPAARGRWWLQPWGASGAMATVLMAGVIGLIWRGEAPGPAREEAVPQVAQAPVSAPVSAPFSAPGLATVPAPAPAPVTAPQTAPEPALATPAAATKQRVLAVSPAVKPPAKTAAQPMAPEPSETLASARDAATAVALPPAPSAPAAPPAAAAPPNAAAPAAAARLRAAAGASLALQPPWRTAPQTGDAFSWQPADRLQPPDAAWLARLAELGAGRWQPLSAAPTTAEVAQLHWQRGGATVARFGFDRSSVWWCSSEGRCERAPLDASTVLNLLNQLTR